MNVLIINGSLGGANGNTNVIIEEVVEQLKKLNITTAIHHLVQDELITKDSLKSADGFIFCTGTYWDSWGSPMQKGLECLTEFEASDLLLGKPAAVIVSMHSVGGKEVLSRLQGVLNTMGLSIPPMSGMVYSLATHLALGQNSSSFNPDFWSLEDLEVIVFNLKEAMSKKSSYKAWKVDHKDPKRRWL